MTHPSTSPPSAPPARADLAARSHVLEGPRFLIPHCPLFCQHQTAVVLPPPLQNMRTDGEENHALSEPRAPLVSRLLTRSVDERPCQR